MTCCLEPNELEVSFPLLAHRALLRAAWARSVPQNNIHAPCMFRSAEGLDAVVELLQKLAAASQFRQVLVQTALRC